MILLHHFTWLQFGIAVFILYLAWYAVVLLLYCGRELRDFFNRASRDKKPEPLPHRWEDDEDDLAGWAAEEEGVETLESGSFSFVARTQIPGRGSNELLGLVPDALEEIKSAVHTVEVNGGGKADFISLFRLVSAKYERLKAGPHLEAINDWIRDNVPFHFSNEELTALWN